MKEKFDPLTEEDLREREEFAKLPPAEKEEEISRLREKAFLENAETFYDKSKKSESELDGKLMRTIISIAEAVKEADGYLVVVGGYARDEALRRFGYNAKPKDYDLEIYGIAYDKLLTLVAGLGKIKEEAGKSFPVIKLSVGKGAEGIIDIALPRTEKKTEVGHTGFEAHTDPFMDLERASLRRDFTINSLCLDPLTGQIIDKHGGLNDMKKGILRATYPEAFKDDPLRVLRLMQFAGRFGFSVDPRTMEEARQVSREELESISRERLEEEWKKLLLRSPQPSIGLEVGRETGLLETLHPELAALVGTPQDPEWHPEGDVWEHTKMVVDVAAYIVRREKLEGDKAFAIMLTALCHDLGKPATTVKQTDGRITARGHDDAGVELTERFLRSIHVLRTEKADPLSQKVLNLVREHLYPLHSSDASAAVVRRRARLLDPATIEEVVLVAEADNHGKGLAGSVGGGFPEGERLLKTARQALVDKHKIQPLIMGRHLLEIGFKPGSRVGEVLKKIEAMQEEGTITTFDEAQAFAKSQLE